MVRLPSTLELLVGARSSPAEQYELLRWVRCLSPQALADRAGVLALLDDVTRRCAAIAASPELAPTGGPTPPQIQVSELRAAGYLDPVGCETFDGWPGEWEQVERIVAEARAALGPPTGRSPGAPVGAWPPASTPPDAAVTCRTCGEQLPTTARFCGYCGIRLT